MKRQSFFKTALFALGLSFFAVSILSSSASALRIPYGPGETLDSPNTPAFNIYYDVPTVGDEADFVRVRKSNGDPTRPATPYVFTDTVNDKCEVGSMFDVRTYVHNGADDDMNDGGNGSAVAHNVRVAMQAPLNTSSKNFTFTSTISASNATSVTDNGKLNCDETVRLKLVPQTVKVYSQPTGWNGAADSAVNGSLALGSRQAGSGDVWGCWTDRVIVVYTVKVEKVPTPPTPPTPTPTPTPTPVTPTALPNTGAGGLAALFTAVSAGGAAAHHVVSKRRKS